MPLPAHAQRDAAASEKIFAHYAACHSNKPGEKQIRTVIGRCFGRKSGTEPGS